MLEHESTPAGIEPPLGSPFSLELEAVAHRLKTKSAQLVDIRTADEYARAHVAGSQHAAPQGLAKAAWAFDRQRPIVLCSATGHEALAAAAALREAGLAAFVVDGGMRAWAQ